MMRKRHFCELFFLAILSPALSIANASPVDPASLVKVTPSNNTKCVEYYSYNGTLYCSPTAQSTQPVDPHLYQYEKLKIVFDDRPWQLAWGKKEDAGTTLEYVPNGEDIDHWNELITSQYFPGLQNNVTPKQFAEMFAQRLINAGYKPIVLFLEGAPNQVLYEFRIEQPENQMQDEIQMITSDDSGLYILHYVIKKADMGQKNRDKWVQNLKNSMIKK